MGKSKYYDTAAALQVLGCVMHKPDLIDDDSQHPLREMDFSNNEFHRTMYGAISNLIHMGAEKINAKAIEDYLEDKQKSLGVYKANGSSTWVQKTYNEADTLNFEYYYDRLKKMTLLRSYDDIGVDVSWIYDPDNILDVDKKESQNKRLDELTLEEVAQEVDDRVLRVREEVVDNSTDESQLASHGMQELLEELKVTPATGYPLYDVATDAIAMGARPGKVYLRSAGTGVGKSRSMMADACYLACDEIYEEGTGWRSTGDQISTVFISVELDMQELQTMALAFISGIDEDKIINRINDLTFDEVERLKHAVEVFDKAPLVFEYFPNYSMKDIENCIKRNIRVHKAEAVVMDYITSSMKMIEEISKASKGMALREDQVLFQLSSKLKDIAGMFDIFILTATQINGMAKDAKYLDQNMLAGAKAIANRVDYGEIMVDVTPQDAEELTGLLAAHPELQMPTVKKSIYKNRRGKTNRILLWMHADKGRCRFKTLFATDFNFNFIPISEYM